MRVLLGLAILLMGLGAFSGALLYSKYHQNSKIPTVNLNPQDISFTDVPPEFLLINAERWYVIPSMFQGVEGADINTDGLTLCKQRKIYYKMGISNKARIRVILWHEIEHAGLCRPRDNDNLANWMPWASEDEHHKVYLDGMFWAEFALSNPNFMKWAANE